MKENGKGTSETSVAIVPVEEQDTIDISGEDVHIDENELKDVCKKPIARFWHEYKDNVYGPDDRKYIFIDNGAKVLAVAHLDTVVDPKEKFNFNSYTRSKVRIIKCPTLDDRLGVYIVTKLLPKLLGQGWADILLTDHEEKGSTTADEFIKEHEGREYNWIVEFDRRGNSLSHEDDAVLYSYSTGGDVKDFRAALSVAGFKKIGRGSFTDIASMQDIGCKGFNVGVGYFNNHSTAAYMKPALTEFSVSNFINFYMKNYNNKYAHTKIAYAAVPKRSSYGKSYYQNDLYSGHSDKVVSSGMWVEGIYAKGDIVRYRKNTHTYTQGQFYYIKDVCLMDSGLVTYDMIGVGGGYTTSRVHESALERAIDVCYYCVAPKDETYMYIDEYGSYYLCNMCVQMVHDGMLMCEECLIEFKQSGDNGDFGTICNSCAEMFAIHIGDVVRLKVSEEKNALATIPFYVVSYTHSGSNVNLWDGKFKFTNANKGFDPLWLESLDRGVTPEKFVKEYVDPLYINNQQENIQ